MNKFMFILQLIPLITNLMKIAENLLGNGTGEKKKAFVVEGVTHIIKAMPGVSTGGQKETWTIINKALDPIKNLINIIAGLFFPNKKK